MSHSLHRSPLYPRVLADIGGTNARFAWKASPTDPITDVVVLACAQFPDLQSAFRTYLQQQGKPVPAAAAFAMANPVTGDEVRMTNHHWSFSQTAFAAELGLPVLRVLNDFTALALALPSLPASDLRQVGGRSAKAGAPIGLVGAGTGLGVSGLLPDGRGHWIALEGEGGHVTLPAVSSRERLVMDGLIARYGRASAERLLSGQGLLDACHILCAADGADASALLSGADVTHAALEHKHAQACEALDLFCAQLGSVAANLALTIGALGGVYIGGGIVPRLGTWFDRSAFRSRFEAKGRFSPYLDRIPVWVITAAQSPALQGASCALDNLANT